MKGKDSFTSVDEYIAAFPKETQKALKQMRTAIRAAAPDAEEKISYRMPGYYQNGYLVYFAGHSNHIGFYPAPSGVAKFKKALAGYGAGKGTLQFPLDKPLPLKLVSQIVKFRVDENLIKTKAKTRKGTSKKRKVE